MFQEPLFNIQLLTRQENTIEAVLVIDSLNEIFEGHFPGQPVVPGASMLQIVKEVLAGALKKTLRLVRADNIKFLSLVEPAASNLQLTINYQLLDNEDIKITANLLSGESVCMKLQGTFTVL